MRTHRFVIAVLSIAAVFGLGFSTVVNLSATQRPATDVERASALISAFDGCIQGRFQEVDMRFGLRRIIKPGETPHRFQPESAREFDAVRGLEAEGFRRPVRASDAMCLQCHHEPVPGVDPARGIEVNALKIGDPMGVVIYGFRKTP